MSVGSQASRTNVYKLVSLDSSAVLDAVERKYGFVVDKCVPQRGFCDMTFHVVEGGRVRNEFIFKIFVDPYTQNSKQMEAEITMMQFLKNHGLPVPHLVPTKDKLLFTKIDFSCGRPYPVRLQSFIKGSLLRDVPVTADLCRHVGLLVGKVDSVLQKFSSHFYDNAVELDFLVNYTESEKLSSLLPYIKDERTRKLASEGFKIFENKIAPNFDSLPIQQIHGDMDCDNLVLDVEGSVKSGRAELGIIDFGDSRKTCRFYEPVATMTSFLVYGVPDSFACAKAFLDAYLSVVRLTSDELKLLRPGVIARLASTITFHQYNATTDPKYDGYMVKTNEAIIYDLLEQLLSDEKNGSPFLS